MTFKTVHIVGGGLAGSEAAWQLAKRGIAVILHEMRPVKNTPAHQTKGLAELVCSNSFRSDDCYTSAIGLLHEEMRRMDSLVLSAADKHRLPAGGALAVDREGFSRAITEALNSNPNVTVIREAICEWPVEAWENVILATGPLTHPELADEIQKRSGQDSLSFFDAIAPIVHFDTVDMAVAWKQSRYDKGSEEGGGADYINCPLDKENYQDFVEALRNSETTIPREWENIPYFDGCLPIEEMALRGEDVLRFGPMKPVGLTCPHKGGYKPYAVVQLRQDNHFGTLWNMVGFQTRMRHGEQLRVLRMIPGLHQAEFARLGGVHRNCYLNSPQVLDGELRLKAEKRIRFAGQITGCEGYVESAAVGLAAGLFSAAQIYEKSLDPLPITTALGSLLNHITGGHLSIEDESSQNQVVRHKVRSFQPMNVNFGLFPPIEGLKLRGLKKLEKGRAKKRKIAERALVDLDKWLKVLP